MKTQTTIVIIGNMQDSATLRAALEAKINCVDATNSLENPEPSLARVMKYADSHIPEIGQELFTKPKGYSGNPRHRHHRR
jgi:saccharopine dehydrogenase-like NADP-dependent oxidoreductase